MTSAQSYQVYLYVGPHPPVMDGARVVDVTPASLRPDDVTAAVVSSGLNPADLRSSVLFIADAPASDAVAWRDKILLAYIAVIGFARRRVDVSFGVPAAALVMSDLDRMFRSLPDAGRAEHTADLVVAVDPDATIPPDVPDGDVVEFGAGLGGDAVAQLRYARRVLLVPAESVSVALPQLVGVAGVRARGERDRMPDLLLGSGVVDAGLVRRHAEQSRKENRSDTRDFVADAIPLTPRQELLTQAARSDITALLARLGAASVRVSDSESAHTVWHCPRPENHTNNDATPSARVTTSVDGVSHFRCFRCLPEKVDALRLTMWARDLTVDEAATWMLDTAAR